MPPIRTKSATVIDTAIGQRIRQFRVARGMSQSTIAQALGLTFQQVQKYEKGSNRLSGSRMVQMCQILGCTPNELTGTGIDVNDRALGIGPTLSAAAIRVAMKWDRCNGAQKAAVSAVLNSFDRAEDE